MKTIYVKFYSPNEVMELTPTTSPQEIKEHCFRAFKYSNEFDALIAYAETPGTLWSTLLEEDTNVESFIDEAFSHIIRGLDADIKWLEQHFTLST